MPSILFENDAGTSQMQPNGDVLIKVNTERPEFKRLVPQEDIEILGELLKGAIKAAGEQRVTGNWSEHTENKPKIILDLSGMEYLSRGAFSKFTIARSKADNVGYNFEVHNAAPEVLKALSNIRTHVTILPAGQTNTPNTGMTR